MNNCLFCNIKEESIILSTNNFNVVYDQYPVNKGHSLIISKEHKIDFFDLSDIELIELNQTISSVKCFIDSEFPSIVGYNIGMNCGRQAGQTINHFHCHLIPRYTDDMIDPSGGVRGCIPEKQHYKKYKSPTEYMNFFNS